MMQRTRDGANNFSTGFIRSELGLVGFVTGYVSLSKEN